MKPEQPVPAPIFQSSSVRDWQFDAVLDNIIMVEYADSDDDGNIKRGSIFVSNDATRNIWRVGRVLMVGNLVPDNVRAGDHVMWPADKGIQCVVKDGKNLVFLDMDRIFGKVEKIN